MVRQPVSKAAVLAAALLVALGGLIYELLLGTASSYLFGDSVTSFSLSIGTMLFGMGIGSLLSVKLLPRAGRNFVLTEILLSLVGGHAVAILFTAFTQTRYYWLVFIGLSMLIGTLIGFEIPLMVRLAKEGRRGDTERLLSRVLALDYIGALAASLLFPFVLLPHLGLVRTGYAMGLLNTLIAYFILRRIDAGPRRRWITALNLAAIAVFVVGFLYANRIERIINTAQYQDPVVLYKLTRYQKLAVTAYGQDVRLYLNDQLQFSSLDEARYHETMAHAALSSVAEPRRVLILGGGDGLLAREVLRYDSVSDVTVVDIDPVMTELARGNRLLTDINQYALSDPRVHVVNQDAFSYVRSDPHSYDAIFVDLVDPANERVAKLYSQDFYAAAHQRLTTTGVFITQATSTYFTPNAFQVIRQTVQSRAGDRAVVPLGVNVPSFGEWGFVLSLPDEGRLFSGTLPTGLAYATPETLRSSRVLPADLRPTVAADAVSSLLRPQVFSVYQTDMRQWRYGN